MIEINDLNFKGLYKLVNYFFCVKELILHLRFIILTV